MLGSFRFGTYLTLRFLKINFSKIFGFLRQEFKIKNLNPFVSTSCSLVLGVQGTVPFSHPLSCCLVTDESLRSRHFR